MIGPRRILTLSALVALIAGCDELTGDRDPDHGSEHVHESDAGHGHDDGGHGHGGGIVVTHFTDRTELFVEFPPLAVGRGSEFAAHFTRLDSFAPVDTGRAAVRLSGGGAPDETFPATPDATAGIFRPIALPEHAVARRLHVVIDTGEFVSVHDLGTYQVHANAAEADATLPEDEEDVGLIPFLKEQQWKVDFATAPVEIRLLSASIPAPGVLEAAPSGVAHIAAPTDGLVMSESGWFPHVGDSVQAGQVIARLSPKVSDAQDYAALVAERDSARAAYEVALADRARVAGLLEEGAVAQRRLDEAQAAELTAKAHLAAATARIDSVHGQRSGVAIALRSPISGRIARVAVGQGEFVDRGDSLIRVIDTSMLRLVADIAEVDAIDMPAPRGAWFTPLGGGQTYRLTADNGHLAGVGGFVDPVKRTVPVIFEFANPDGAWRAGTAVEAHILVGDPFEGPVVPSSAIVDDAGQQVVFVMADGENWERRVVRTTVRDGSLVGVAAGVEPGERVVSRGAYLVHLAATGPAEAGHGHAH